jgi:hypothetical protein
LLLQTMTARGVTTASVSTASVRMPAGNQTSRVDQELLNDAVGGTSSGQITTEPRCLILLQERHGGKRVSNQPHEGN